MFSTYRDPIATARRVAGTRNAYRLTQGKEVADALMVLMLVWLAKISESATLTVTYNVLIFFLILFSPLVYLRSVRALLEARDLTASGEPKT